MARINFNSWQTVERFLKMRGIQKVYINEMRNMLIKDAIVHKDYFMVARFYTAFGLALYDQCGFTEEQLAPIYQQVYEIMAGVGNDEFSWHDKMKELEEKANIIINIDPEFSEIELPEEGTEEGGAESGE